MEALPDIIIQTGDPVPCDGIWEPISIEYPRKWLLVKTGIRGMNAPLQMHYDVLLESDTTILIPDEPVRYRRVYWRLVWEDTRYCDWILPDESDYFLEACRANVSSAQMVHRARMPGSG